MPNTKNKERICINCKSKYFYCPHCGEDANKPTWMFILCSEDCHTAFQTTTDYRAGEITGTQAKENFKTIDMSKKSKFSPDIQAAIDEVMTLPDEEVTMETKADTSKKYSGKKYI